MKNQWKEEGTMKLGDCFAHYSLDDTACHVCMLAAECKEVTIDRELKWLFHAEQTDLPKMS